MIKIFIVSDGSGRTAQQALQAALVQFPDSPDEIEIELFNGIRSVDQIEDILYKAGHEGALVIHTLVSENLRHLMHGVARNHIVETIDLMGPLLFKLADHLSYQPSGKPGLYHQANEEYFKRIDAVQYTFNHDDGIRAEQLEDAEIILLGVSRTFKTPVSIYLAYKGWRVANIPIVEGMELPAGVMNANPGNVFCLHNSPLGLSKLRQSRQDYLKGYAGPYASLEQVKRELNFANHLFMRQPLWRIINVANKSIEEIASEILTNMHMNSKITE
ncbi:MAG: pyruvate, water dikinase regulatory protein [Bacteroidales bacterium]|nr:pyruvate, water dikinase regulatory protein [Bacteroidales bacterium]